MEQDAGTTPPWSGTVNFRQTTADKEKMHLLSDVQLLANTWNTKIILLSYLSLRHTGTYVYNRVQFPARIRQFDRSVSYFRL